MVSVICFHWSKFLKSASVGTQLTRSELKTILLKCFDSIMNSDGGNLMKSAYFFLHPNILYLTLYNYFANENKRLSLRHCIRSMYRFTNEQSGTLWTRASSGSSERQREREREFVGDWIDLNPTCVTTTNTNQPIITITNQSPKY